jgi:hypothetical protein
MQKPAISLNDNTPNDHVKPAKNQIKVIWNLRLFSATGHSAFTDLKYEQ